jgi:hypothetical protein
MLGRVRADPQLGGSERDEPLGQTRQCRRDIWNHGRRSAEVVEHFGEAVGWSDFDRDQDRGPLFDLG